ncbi:glycosyltransferase [Enterococcus sp. DIV1059_2]|uniref:glycosyltransferase n=1 Tax=Enterococcus sp. DIV1059_2 TaxID=2774664 RepID=UPI003F28D3D6
MKIVYVILHYITDLDTLECIDSITLLNQYDNIDYEIVVVDNGSPSNFKLSKNNKKISLLRLDENLGFAGGNNEGIKFAKQHLRADFVVCLNNDVVLKSLDFNQVLVDKYEMNGYYVLGPDIVTLNDKHQNPLQKSEWSVMEISLFRCKQIIKLLLLKLHAEVFLKSLLKNTHHDYLSASLKGDKFEVGLHGSCLIFSKKFLDKYDGFVEGTFLYMEEDLLKLRAISNNELMMYTSDLEVLHKEDSATDAIKASDRQKYINKTSFLIKSAKVYRNMKFLFVLKDKVYGFIEKIVCKLKHKEFKLDRRIPLSYFLSFFIRRSIMVLRGVYISIKKGKKPRIFFIGKKVKMYCLSRIEIGKGVTIGDNTILDALSINGLKLGANSSIGSSSIIRCSGNLKEIGKGFILGENSSLADNCFVGATGGVSIGSNVICGQNVRFHSSNHNFDDRKININEQGINAKGIVIGNNCWIGAGTVFLDGVNIGSGCVIGANSVITKSFPDNSVVVGTPAKLIRIR